MAQFDVFKTGNAAFPLVLDIQSELLGSLATRIVVPLAARKRYGPKLITRLNPTAVIAGVEYVLVFQELSSFPSASLRDRVGSLTGRRAELIAAIDLLITGV
jgi:toxin CcdB